jgi:large-conductance mechanosensitive channel
VRGINQLQRRLSPAEEEKAPPAPLVPSEEVKLLTEIRDLLKERSLPLKN